MANKIETSSKNFKPRINLNHNIYLNQWTTQSCFIRQVQSPNCCYLKWGATNLAVNMYVLFIFQAKALKEKYMPIEYSG